MARIKCDFYTKNGMTISAIAVIDSQEELDEEIEKSKNILKKFGFMVEKGLLAGEIQPLNLKTVLDINLK